MAGTKPSITRQTTSTLGVWSEGTWTRGSNAARERGTLHTRNARQGCLLPGLRGHSVQDNTVVLDVEKSRMHQGTSLWRDRNLDGSLEAKGEQTR